MCAIVLDLKERDCQEQNARRGDGARPGHVVRRQWRALQRSVKLLSKQGYRRRYRLRTPDEAREASIVREPLDCDIRDQHGPFDIVVGLLKPRFSGRESTGLIDEVGAWSFCCVTTARALAVSLLLTELGLSSAIAVAFEKQDLGMVGQAVDQSDGARGVGEDGVPAFEG